MLMTQQARGNIASGVQPQLGIQPQLCVLTTADCRSSLSNVPIRMTSRNSNHQFIDDMNTSTPLSPPVQTRRPAQSSQSWTT